MTKKELKQYIQNNQNEVITASGIVYCCLLPMFVMLGVLILIHFIGGNAQ